MIEQLRLFFTKADFRYIDNIVKTGQISQGRYVDLLQDEFSKIIGLPYSFATSSGTAALHLALLSLNIGRGDEVILPSYTCTALLNAINYVNATPVIVDVDAGTFNITHSLVKKRITRRTKAIIVTHTFGFPADMDEILKLGIPAIEDCAHALGATYKGKPAGTKGMISVFSLYATKMITAGEGGMICTNDKKISEIIYDLNSYDRQDSYRIRYNYKMSDLTAGIALSQLRKLNFFIKGRISIAKQYRKAFSLLPLGFQKALFNTRPNYYRFIICSPLSNKVIKFTQRRGIMCDRPIYKPLHYYINTSLKDNFRGTDFLYKNAISVPIYPVLHNKEVSRIIDVVKDSLEQSGD